MAGWDPLWPLGIITHSPGISGKKRFPVLQVKGRARPPERQQGRLGDYEALLAALRIRVGGPRKGEKQETGEKEKTLDLKAARLYLSDLVICKCFIISCRTLCLPLLLK